jgi:hypothetical protein
MVPGLLTDEQRTLVLRYRTLDADLQQAKAVVRDLTDEATLVMGRLSLAGMTLPRLMEVLQIPDSLRTKTKLRVETGREILAAAVEPPPVP